MVTSRTWWWCLPAVLAVGCANVDDTDVDDVQDQQSGLVCGMEVLPSPQTLPATACEDGRTVIGPVRVEKGWNWVEREELTFELEDAGEVCVRIEASGHKTFLQHLRDRKKRHGHYGHGRNHDDDDGSADEPWVPKAYPFAYLDGDKIARPQSFFDDRTEEQTHDLEAGEHSIDIKLLGWRGAYVDVEVRERFDGPADALDMTNADGSLRLTNVATNHPLVTPNGDGHHDTTNFVADVEPLNELPGKDDGTVDYFLEWEFQVVDLDSCGTIDTQITGVTQVNSPTRINASWDGRDSTGTLLPTGNYAYVFSVRLVDEFGVDFGAIQSPAYGLIVDAAPADYDELPEHIGECNPATDPYACRCPGGGGIPGTMDPNCSFGMIQHLLDDAGFPPGTLGNYYDPSIIDKSFIETTQDPDTGRYTVTVDLQEYSAGGLVPKGSGIWEDEATLRQWVADMTGVPVSTGDSLFNFDYVQLGTSTGVNLLGKSNHSFNHFFLDAITDDDGMITVNGVTTDLAAFFNSDDVAPEQFATGGRDGDECTTGGNSNGVDTLKASFCAYNTAVPIGDATDLGVYMLRASMFDIAMNGVGTVQDELCVINAIFSCGIRTVRVPADSLEIESSYYASVGGVAEFTRTETIGLTDAAAVSFTADRGDGEDGVCSRAVATRDGLAVRMDSADGTVPETCVINGVFPF